MITNSRPKVGRNDVCPFCASGRKFKLCCGAPKEDKVRTGFRYAGHKHEAPPLLLIPRHIPLGPVPAEATWVQTPDDPMNREFRSARAQRRVLRREKLKASW